MNNVAAVEYEAVIDVRRGGPLRRLRTLVLGLVAAAAGDPGMVSGDLVVRRRSDHFELLRVPTQDEADANQLLEAAREDMQRLSPDDLAARWSRGRDD